MTISTAGASRPAPLPCRACDGAGVLPYFRPGQPTGFLAPQQRCAACAGRGSVGRGFPDAPLDVGQGNQARGLPPSLAAVRARLAAAAEAL